jgi:hypothetical protein
MITQEQRTNFELFQECLSTALIQRVSNPQKSQRRRRSKAKKQSSSDVKPESPEDVSESDADDLAEFIEYIAAETFQSLPDELRTLDYHTYAKDADFQARYALPLTASDIEALLPSLDPSIEESLLTYGITDPQAQSIANFLAPILTSYLSAVSTPPPAPISTKSQVAACEICGRDWINLSYHHLIPRFVHAKAVKRGWHREDELQNVAWLCGACHRFVHKFAGHEELARFYYTVDLLMEREEVRRWADWVGRLRWKGR